MNNLLGYSGGLGFIYRLTGFSKLVFFVLVSIAVMTTYDMHLNLAMGLFSVVLFRLANIKWRQVSFIIKFVLVFAIINVFFVYIFQPSYGEKIYQAKDVLWQGTNHFYLTQQELFYLANLALKYFCTLPLAVLFLLTTDPSEFAASLNQFAVPYKVAYAVSLTLRYIPDIQEEFFMIRTSQEARGEELSRKAGLRRQFRGNIRIILPLIFSSLDRIEKVSMAMELRRFGKNKRRTWYVQRPIKAADLAVMAVAVGVLLVAFALFYVNNGRFYNPWQI